MGKYNIAVIPGDGIGPDIVREAKKVLDAVGKKFGHEFIYTDVLMGGIAIDITGVPLPDETLAVCRDSASVILGAIGGYKWDTLPGDMRPEAGLLGIRKGLGLFANLRPAKIHAPLIDASPLKPEILSGVDIIVVRELCGGIYFGERGRGEAEGLKYAYDTEKYDESEIKRISKVAFEIAAKRNKKVCSVDKANILDSSRLWREEVVKLSESYKDISLSHMYVDNAAMQLVRNPAQFDVIVTSNMFGDILSDELSMICGSIGMLPSASLREDNFGLYEPIHGSAPDIAGMNIANPLGTILSSAMMLRYSLSLDEEADAIEKAVESVLNAGIRTKDIAKPEENTIGTVEMGDAVAARV